MLEYERSSIQAVDIRDLPDDSQVVLRVTTDDAVYLVGSTREGIVVEADCKQLKQQFGVRRGSVLLATPDCFTIVEVGQTWDLAYRTGDFSTTEVKDLALVFLEPFRVRPKLKGTL